MFDKFLKFIQKWHSWIVAIFTILVLLACLFSCQGLFNVNAKESKVDVSLVDSLKVGGAKSET